MPTGTDLVGHEAMLRAFGIEGSEDGDGAHRGNGSSLLYPRTDDAQRRQAIDGFLRAPHHPAQDEDAVERIVVSPGVVAGDAHEDAARADFASPHLRGGRVLFEASGEDIGFGSGEVAGKMPVAFVGDLEGVEASGERVIFVEHPIARAMAILRGRDFPRGAESAGDMLSCAGAVSSEGVKGEAVEAASMAKAFAGGNAITKANAKHVRTALFITDALNRKRSI